MPSTAAVAASADQQSPENGQVVLAEAVLSHASILARAGRLDEAAEVLVEIKAGAEGVRILDLLAKVRAQQGRYEDAEALWSRAKALSGSHAYDAALKRVGTVRRIPSWLPSVRLIAGVIFVAVLAIVLARTPWRKPTAHPAPVVGMQDAAPLQHPRGKGPEQGRADAFAAQPVDFSGLGVNQAARDGGVELTFTVGLFQAGVSLRPDAVAILDALGARLGRAPPGTIVITGHTDDIPVAVGKDFADNTSLGLARATVVMHRLVASSPLPAASFLIGTAGDASGPYPNDTLDNRLRNRTVTLQFRQGTPSR